MLLKHVTFSLSLMAFTLGIAQSSAFAQDVPKQDIFKSVRCKIRAVSAPTALLPASWGPGWEELASIEVPTEGLTYTSGIEEVSFNGKQYRLSFVLLTPVGVRKLPEFQMSLGTDDDSRRADTNYEGTDPGTLTSTLEFTSKSFLKKQVWTRVEASCTPLKY